MTEKARIAHLGFAAGRLDNAADGLDNVQEYRKSARALRELAQQIRGRFTRSSTEPARGFRKQVRRHLTRPEARAIVTELTRFRKSLDATSQRLGRGPYAADLDSASGDIEYALEELREIQ